MKRINLSDAALERKVLSIASQFGYRVSDDVDGRWIENDLTASVFEHIRISSSNIPTADSIIEKYLQEINIAGGLDYTKCLDLISRVTREVSLENIEFFKRGIFFCPQTRLKDFFREAVAPIFFGVFPEGQILITRSSLVYHKRMAFSRLLYTLTHYPDALSSLANDFKGFRSLSKWNRIDPTDFLSIILNIMRYLYYPYVTCIKATNFYSLIFLFFPRTSFKYEKPLFPSNWLDFLKGDADFAKEDQENSTGDIFDMPVRSIHAKYVVDSPPTFGEILALAEWTIEAADQLVRKLSDITNFTDQSFSDVIDPIYAQEYSQSLMHVFRDSATIITSDSKYWNKAATFRIADILVGLAKHGSLNMGDDFFKDLFRYDKGRILIEQILTDTGILALINFAKVTKEIYENLKKTILDSVWIPTKKTTSGVMVRNRGLTNENIENDDEFIGNVLRSLRNTHHGYLTRADTYGSRPSRYLSLIDGNTSDDFPTLSIAWAMALLASPGKLIGTP